MAGRPVQLTLSLFETTALAGGLTLDTGRSVPVVDIPEPEETIAPVADSRPEPQRFRLSGDRTLARGWKARAADNLAAIRLSAAIEAEGRPATAEEQDRLGRFTAFGARDLAENLFRRSGQGFKPGWEELAEGLEAAVSREELASLARASQYAHYTPEFIIREIWRTVARLGFQGGSVLEPGCGAGLFFALMPDAVGERSDLTGVEMDPTSARIARLLFPDARILCQDFTKSRLPETFDLAIGNPPFSDRTVRAEDESGRLHLSLHDYFIARSIRRLRPGGIGAFVTSRWTMDKIDPAARRHIAEVADLLGAVRLPEGAMAESAGTDVVVDILVFQRRLCGSPAAGADWESLGEAVPAEEGDGALAANRYFLDHPEMVLGRHARTSSSYGPAYTCRATEGDLAQRLALALDTITAVVPVPYAKFRVVEAHPEVQVGTAAEGAAIKEGSYLVRENRLMQIENGAPVVVPVRQGGQTGIPVKHARLIRRMIPIRDAVRDVLRAQEADEAWGPAQVRLRVAYGAFAREFGPINLTTVSETTDPETGAVRETYRYPNLAPFADDPDVWLVASVETYDLETGKATQGPIFTDRVLHPPATPLVQSAADALAVALHETGRVDLDRIAELLGCAREAALADLGEAVFLNPTGSAEGVEAWETADQYLSGAVRTKLAVARASAALDPRFARNVAALERVQPEDLKPSDITARLGAPWIPTDVVREFCGEVIGIWTRIRHTVAVGAWSVDQDPFRGQAAATSEWGTERRHAGQLVSDALNATIPAIYDVWIEDGKERRELNAEDTEAAKEKLQKIKTAFERFVWTDPDRTERLTRIYNDRFNNLVPRHFDGRHLTLPGASSVISFRPHQKRAIWRIISAGATYVAHAVGAGKTFAMAAAIMEQKRLGLITKAMLAVPGHCLAQWSREFLQLYPTARILVADETNFCKAKRQRFLARAATAQWDCIIITHAAFKFIAAPASFERGLIQEELASYAQLLETVDGDDRFSRKRIERLKEGLQDKLEALKSRKDDLLTIGEIGVDQILVDEAQEFRKLSFATNMSGLKGIDPDGSQRAWDLLVKSRFIAERNADRAMILASGTPITNTLGEMFTLQRYMQPAALAERGLQNFDAWAATFGETRTELELQPSGQYKPETRFSEFVNVADLMAMYRSFADVVLKDDLRQHVRLPAIEGGKRQIITADPSPAFKAYQKHLAERIRIIKERKGKPEKGQDILLSVITDGRHAAIDMRFVLPDYEDEPANKLNALIDNVHRIWVDTGHRRYSRPDGTPYLLPGAAQMVFSDLGTMNAEATRGFSAYRWIRDRLVALGVPPQQIAFMQDYKKSTAKQRLFQEVNAGKVRILIGSSETMGTGVNAQVRLVALHHLDVPWLVSHIEQREGRIERQGNQNEEIGIYGYALTGSVDATGWQMLERKARFISMAMAGDRSVRRLEDAGSQVNQFALAKAIASGDPRLMQKAGLEAEIARLDRLRAAHFDDQHAVRRAIANARSAIAGAERRIVRTDADIARRISTRGDAFRIEVEDRAYGERREGGAALLNLLRHRAHETKKARRAGQAPQDAESVGRIGGFDITVSAGRLQHWSDRMEVCLERTDYAQEVEYSDDLSALGLISRLEHMLGRFELDIAEARRELADARDRLPAYERRLGESFEFEGELAGKQAALAAIEADLARNDDADERAVAVA